MKNIVVYSLIAVAIAFTSCATSSISVRVLKPADITLPSNIKTVAIMNRSLADKDSKLGNIIEGVLTGEQLFGDREGSEKCIIGLYDQLNTTDRFVPCLPKDVEKYKGTGTDKWPEPLKEGDIEGICRSCKADALIVLETFDSDQGLKYNDVERTRKNNDGTTAKYMAKVAHLDIGISAGWRIYYPVKKEIIDQNVFVDHKHWDAEGLTESEASGRLPVRRHAVNDAGYFAGQQYGYRISPAWVWVGRTYFVKGNDNLKDGKFKVKAKAWEEAEQIWLKDAKNPDPKIAGRATHNLALAREVQGDLEKALEWAKISYADYHNKKARGFIADLEQRIRDQRKLEQQMGE